MTFKQNKNKLNHNSPNKPNNNNKHNNNNQVMLMDLFLKLTDIKPKEMNILKNKNMIMPLDNIWK